MNKLKNLLNRIYVRFVFFIININPEAIKKEHENKIQKEMLKKQQEQETIQTKEIDKLIEKNIKESNTYCTGSDERVPSIKMLRDSEGAKVYYKMKNNQPLTAKDHATVADIYGVKIPMSNTMFYKFNQNFIDFTIMQVNAVVLNYREKLDEVSFSFILNDIGTGGHVLVQLDSDDFQTFTKPCYLEKLNQNENED